MNTEFAIDNDFNELFQIPILTQPPKERNRFNLLQHISKISNENIDKKN